MTIFQKDSILAPKFKEIEQGWTSEGGENSLADLLVKMPIGVQS